MKLSIASLNSGSNGNCYYIGNGQEAVLVDAGISCREVEKRMRRLDLDIGQVKAVLISHEHTDHIKGLAVLANKHRLPVYISEATRKEARIKLDKNRVFDIAHQDIITIGRISVVPFRKQHDAVDPFSFVISSHSIHVGVFTDIGHPSDELVHYFRQCHAAFLETNYDEEMLESGGYPKVLKKRIRGGKGHLSNTQALDLFKKHRPAHMSHLLLSHLSENNNSPELVQDLFGSHANGVKVIVASRFEESGVFRIGSNEKAEPICLKPSGKVHQLSMNF